MTHDTWRPQASGARQLKCVVMRTYPHDCLAFTQGLACVDGVLYEATGWYGRSGVRRVDVASGIVQAERKLAAAYFGEDITIWGATILQITWTSGRGFVYDRDSLEVRRTFDYTGEGWGLTNDGRRLIMSDGTDVLRLLAPDTFAEIGALRVMDGDRPVGSLNALEYMDGCVLANVRGADVIAQVRLDDGQVVAWIDCSGLYDRSPRIARLAVLNGVARSATPGRLLVTGKLWPYLFEVALQATRTAHGANH